MVFVFAASLVLTLSI